MYTCRLPVDITCVMMLFEDWEITWEAHGWAIPQKLFSPIGTRLESTLEFRGERLLFRRRGYRGED